MRMGYGFADEAPDGCMLDGQTLDAAGSALLESWNRYPSCAPCAICSAEQLRRVENGEAFSTRLSASGSSLSFVLPGGLYRWISKALSTLRHLNRPHRRRIGIA